jgi:hypothetical protein
MSILSKIFGGKSLPTSEIADLDGQVQALLTNSAYEYVASRPGFTHIEHDSYRRVFTVRRKEIEAYIAEHQLVVEDYGAKYHWLKLFQRGEHWIVSQFRPPEKGPGYEDETTFQSYEAARDDLLTKLLTNTLTGIRF